MPADAQPARKIDISMDISSTVESTAEHPPPTLRTPVVRSGPVQPASNVSNDAEPDHSDTEPLGAAPPELLSRRHKPQAEWPRIDGYQIERELGRGGMGVVYAAQETADLRRRVALKVMIEADDPADRERFQTEAQTAANLQHPHILQVFSFGWYEERPYYTMPLVEGRSLREILRRLRNAQPASLDLERLKAAAGLRSIEGFEPVSNDQQPAYYRLAAFWTACLADAAAAAHRAGVLHRDLKPANILVNRDGRVFMADFGLARISGRAEVTRAGQIVGSLPYLSPQRIQGGSAEPRDDIYALGLILYELLTLQRAFSADSDSALLAQVATCDPPRPCLRHPGVPVDLEAICLQAIARDVSQRTASAELLAAQLRRWLRDEVATASTPARPSGNWRRTTTACVAATTLMVALAIHAMPDFGRGTLESESRESDRSTPPPARGDVSPEVAKPTTDVLPPDVRPFHSSPSTDEKQSSFEAETPLLRPSLEEATHIAAVTGPVPSAPADPRPGVAFMISERAVLLDGTAIQGRWAATKFEEALRRDQRLRFMPQGAAPKPDPAEAVIEVGRRLGADYAVVARGETRATRRVRGLSGGEEEAFEWRTELAVEVWDVKRERLVDAWTQEPNGGAIQVFGSVAITDMIRVNAHVAATRAGEVLARCQDR